MAARERPSKRAKAELEDAVSPPWPPAASNSNAPEPEAIGLSLERLPGDLLSRILQLLPLKEAFRVREVSRAIRDAVEGTAFDGAKLDLDAMRTEELEGLERLVREGRLKGSELHISVKSEWAPSSLGEQPHRLIAALAGRCRSVRVKFAHSVENIVGQRVAEVVAALAPGGAASPLQELAIELLSKQAFYNPRDALEIPVELLAPLAGLRTLLLPDLPLSVGTAAGIAARLPALRCLQFFYGKDQRGALKRLGPLCLERLVLHTAPRPGDDFCVRLGELSGTPLGRSLRELHVEEMVAYTHGFTSLSFSADDLGALAGMPQLEAVTGYVGLMKDLDGAVSRGLQSLLRAPRLSVLQLSLEGPGPTITFEFNAAPAGALAAAFLGRDSSTTFSAALAAALAAGPLHSRLALDLRVSCSWRVLEQIVNAGAGPILRGVDVNWVSPHADRAGSVSAALLRCTRLESLFLCAEVISEGELSALAAGLAPLAALPPLPGGLRFEVLLLDKKLAAEANASLSAALPAAALFVRRAGTFS
eukprot:tig00001007_g6235.t1